MTGLRLGALRNAVSPDFSYSQSYLSLLSAAGSMSGIICCAAPSIKLVMGRVVRWVLQRPEGGGAILFAGQQLNAVNRSYRFPSAWLSVRGNTNRLPQLTGTQIARTSIQDTQNSVEPGVSQVPSYQTLTESSRSLSLDSLLEASLSTIHGPSSTDFDFSVGQEAQCSSETNSAHSTGGDYEPPPLRLQVGVGQSTGIQLVHQSRNCPWLVSYELLWARLLSSRRVTTAFEWHSQAPSCGPHCRVKGIYQILQAAPSTLTGYTFWALVVDEAAMAVEAAVR